MDEDKLLEHLLARLALLLQGAAAEAVTTLPSSLRERLARFERLASAGRDATLLAQAGTVLLDRPDPAGSALD